MKLYTLSLYLSETAQPLCLMYSSEERAKQAYRSAQDFTGSHTLNDDFGVEVTLETKPVARVLCDVAEELNGQIEITLLQQRAQLKAQKRAQSDPTLSNQGSIIPFRGN